jgi:RNA polymerase sigma-70 factor (ECF subfamily)
LNTFFEAQRRLTRGSGDSAVQDWLANQPDHVDESAVWDREYERRLLDVAAEQVRLEFENPTWQAFWRTAVEGQPAKEAAEGLGMSVGAVYIAKSRVLNRIKEKVALLRDE